MHESAEKAKKCEEELKRCKQIIAEYERMCKDSTINLAETEIAGSYLVIPTPEKKT